MASLAYRIAKAEVAVAPAVADPFGLAGMTFEQRCIFGREMALEILRRTTGDFTTETRARCQTEIAEVEDRVRSVGRTLVRYPKHWAWVAGLWDECWRGSCGEWVPPVADSWGAGWSRYDAAGVIREMAWRREMRHRPDIAQLLTEGEAEGRRCLN